MRRTLIGAALVAVLGCGGAPDGPVVSGPEIDDVALRGVTRFSAGQVLEHLYGGETSWVPLTPDYVFDPAIMAVDARRLEALYRAYGYEDARVVGWEARPDGDEVDLIITVEEGPVTRVSEVAFDWVGDVAEAVKRDVEASAGLHAGDPFEIPRLNDTIGTLRLALRLRGHPFARVVGDAVVDPVARTGRVQLALEPGPHAQLGRVEFSGLVDVPEYLCEREIRFAAGSEYSPATTRQMERALAGMDVFRWVGVYPVEPVHDGVVDLEVRVSEAPPQSIRLGFGVGFEATRWEEWVSAKYSHTNLFGHLTRLDLNALAGWAQLPNPLDTQAHGPVAKLRPTFTKKGLLEDYLVWTLAPAFETNIRQGYKFWSPSNRFGVGRWFAGFIRADLSHNWRHVDFFDIAPDLDQNSTQLGRDFRDPYQLSYLEAQLDLHFVDDLLAPRNGLVLEFVYDLAGGPFSGDFDHHKATGGARAYWQVTAGLQVAARATTGVIWLYGPDAGVPFDRRFYLGGTNTVRGWGTDRLSPRLDCSTDANPDACVAIPIGGSTVVQGNLELRYNLAGDFYVAAFGDVGDVQAGEFSWAPAEWNYSAGPGLRYDSPLGLFRLDIGVRLNDPGVLPDEPRWAGHFGLGESF